MVKCSLAAFGITALSWQQTDNHYVYFPARFLGLVVPMLTNSLQAHVRGALIVDWHSLLWYSQNLSLTPQSTLLESGITAESPQPNIHCSSSLRGYS